jgi:UDPglucose 6-dehydrogenase
MNIAIIGSGYVGTTAAGIFALAGHDVIALDIDEEKVSAINSGKAPFFETGLNEIIAAAVKENMLKATTDYKKAITSADMIFSCVGTPDKPDGSSDLRYVYNAAESAAKYTKPGAVYIQKSTVPVGTGRNVIKLLPSNTAYVSNPEFLREGTAISDTLLFDRVVAGGDDVKSVEKVLDAHKTVEKSALKIAKIAGLDIADKLTGHKGEYVSSQLESAELIKVTANAFLALKISFANSIAKLADHTGADINEVMDAVGADKRIGRAFLNAGRGYGGGCFPKDVSGLISSATEHGVDLQIMTAAADLNETMPGYIANKAQSVLGSLEGKKVAVLGLAFKAGTSDARRSPGVKLANILHHGGAEVSVYDPEANGEAKEDLRKGIIFSASAKQAAGNTDAVFVATDWPEFLEIDLLKLVKNMRGKLFVDCMNAFTPAEVMLAGFRYVGVGR